jgi:hypothetical protein
VEVLFDRIVHRGATSVSKVRLPATLVVRDSSRTRISGHPL